MFVRVTTSVADPDPYVCGSPVSGSNTQRSGSSYSFFYQAKIVRKTLTLYAFLSLKNYVTAASKVISKKNFFLSCLN
jgi:hypothetical protein